MAKCKGCKNEATLTARLDKEDIPVKVCGKCADLYRAQGYIIVSM